MNSQASGHSPSRSQPLPSKQQSLCSLILKEQLIQIKRLRSLKPKKSILVKRAKRDSRHFKRNGHYAMSMGEPISIYTNLFQWQPLSLQTMEGDRIDEMQLVVPPHRFENNKRHWNPVEPVAWAFPPTNDVSSDQLANFGKFLLQSAVSKIHQPKQIRFDIYKYKPAEMVLDMYGNLQFVTKTKRPNFKKANSALLKHERSNSIAANKEEEKPTDMEYIKKRLSQINTDDVPSNVMFTKKYSGVSPHPVNILKQNAFCMDEAESFSEDEDEDEDQYQDEDDTPFVYPILPTTRAAIEEQVDECETDNQAEEAKEVWKTLAEEVNQDAEPLAEEENEVEEMYVEEVIEDAESLAEEENEVEETYVEEVNEVKETHAD